MACSTAVRALPESAFFLKFPFAFRKIDCPWGPTKKTQKQHTLSNQTAQAALGSAGNTELIWQRKYWGDREVKVRWTSFFQSEAAGRGGVEGE
jgi:hypothetical protein